MMVELLVLFGSAYLGRVLARRLSRRTAGPEDGTRASADGRASATAPGAMAPGTAADSTLSFEPFPCALGDVVLRRTEGDEAWLESALVFSDSAPVAALFVAPEVGGDRAIFVRAGQEDVVWLEPGEKAPSVVLGEPPPTFEYGGARFTRTRRMPVRVERCGDSAPRLGDRAILAEYEGMGAQRLVMIVTSEGAHAWRGVTVLAADVDVLPGSLGR